MAEMKDNIEVKTINEEGERKLMEKAYMA